MVISLNWIKRYVDLDSGLSELSEALTGLGFEIEGIQAQGAGVEGVVAADVLDCSRHPEADKLSLCTVTDGQNTYQVVCGAPNVAPGQRVLLAKMGASLPGGVKIKKSKIRGQESQGMLCAEDELGLGEGHEGILILNPDVALGTPLRDVPGLCDTLLEINVTPNRPDALSHIGIARELAAHFGKKIRYPELRLHESRLEGTPPVTVRVEALEGCSKYVGRIIEGVRVGPSPAWLVAALKSVGKKSINNVVDLTNFVLLEFGQPSHAFDLNKLAARSVIVRHAHEGERLLTLDQEERKLAEADLIIADGNGPICMAGIMGGAGSEVDAATTSIFLEVAYFKPSLVRRQAKRHALNTDSSHRFERGVDPLHLEWISDYLAGLVAESAGGTVLGGRIIAQSPEHPHSRRIVYLRPARATKVLGLDLEEKRMLSLLEGIEIRKKAVEDLDGTGIAFEIPGFRADLEREVDLIEELARLHNFNNIPVLLPSLPLNSAPLPPIEALTRDLRHFLAAQGLNETLTLRFMSLKLLEKMGLEASDRRKKYVKLRNPLSEDWELLPTSLLPSLLQAAAFNQNNQERTCRFFEVSRVFFEDIPKRSERCPGVIEEDVLGIVLTGEWKYCSWNTENSPVNYFALKGLVENLLARMVLKAELHSRAEEVFLHPRDSARIVCQGKKLGSFGMAHPRVLSAFGLKGPVAVMEMSLSEALGVERPKPEFVPFGNFSSVTRESNILVEEEATHEDLLAKMPLASVKNLREVRLNSIYRGQGVPEGKKALHYSFIYQHPDRTLTDEEVNSAQEKLVRELAREESIIFK